MTVYDEVREIQPSWLRLAAMLVALCLGYCLWRMVPEQGLLAQSPSGAQVIAEEGPVICSSPNPVAPKKRPRR